MNSYCQDIVKRNAYEILIGKPEIMMSFTCGNRRMKTLQEILKVHTAK